jgi:phosphoglucosamine mutase
MHKMPQVMINVSMPGRPDLSQVAPVQEAVAATEFELGSRGRVLLRPSGTEPVVRVMVEGEDGAEVKRLCQELATRVEKELAVLASQ